MEYLPTSTFLAGFQTYHLDSIRVNRQEGMDNFTLLDFKTS